MSNLKRTEGFIEAKHRVINAIDARIDKYTAESCFENGHNSRMLKELNLLKSFVKGMVVQADETQSSG